MAWWEDQNIAKELDVFLWRNEDETWTAMNYRQWEKVAYPTFRRGDDDTGLGNSTARQPAENNSNSPSASDGLRRGIIVGGEAYLYNLEGGSAPYSSDFAIRKFEAKHKFLTIDAAEATSPPKFSLNAQPGECYSGQNSPSNNAQQIIYAGGEAYLYLPNQVADHSPTPAPTPDSAAANAVTCGDASSGPNTKAFNFNSGFSVGTPLAPRLMRAAADITSGCNVKAATDDDVD